MSEVLITKGYLKWWPFCVGENCLEIWTGENRMSITNRVTQQALEGSESVSRAIRKRGGGGVREMQSLLAAYHSADRHDFYGMSRVPVLFCRILMEAGLINELVVGGTRKDRGDSLWTTIVPRLPPPGFKEKSQSAVLSCYTYPPSYWVADKSRISRARLRIPDSRIW